MLGAFLVPLGDRLLAEKPEERFIPGAPSGPDFPVAGTDLFAGTSVEITNISSNPSGGYKPLNVGDALTVRPGDRLRIGYSCPLGPTVGPPEVSLATLMVPAGLRRADLPVAAADNQKDVEGDDYEGLGYSWILRDNVPRKILHGHYDVEVISEHATYLTIWWSCATYSRTNETFARGSRAILRVDA